MLLVAIAAALGDIVALRRIVEIGEARIIQLQVGAPKLAQRLDLIGVDLLQVVPEQAHLRIHGRIDDGGAAPVVHHARGRDRELRRVPRDGLQKREVLAEDGLVELERARHPQRRRIELDVAFLVVELDFQSVHGARHATHLVEKVHVPGATAKLTVRDALQADVLLQAHDVADRGVLGVPQLRGRNAPVLVGVTGLLQDRRAQQAPHVIGAKWRL